MIESITMRNCASYDETGIKLEHCQKVNFIYGANGSGKTTISSFLSHPEDPKFSDSEIVWNNGEPSIIKVYNRRFREENLQKESIDGIFTIGEDAIQSRERIRALNEEKSRREHSCKS